MLDLGAGYGLLAHTTAWQLNRYRRLGYDPLLHAVSVDPSETIDPLPQPWPAHVRASVENFRRFHEDYVLEDAGEVEGHVLERIRATAAQYIAEYGSSKQGWFDLIVAQQSFMYLPNKLETFAALYNMLRPGGVMLIHTQDYPWFTFLHHLGRPEVCGEETQSQGDIDPLDFMSPMSTPLAHRWWFGVARIAVYALVRTDERTLGGMLDYVGEKEPHVPLLSEHEEGKAVWSQVSESIYGRRDGAILGFSAAP